MRVALLTLALLTTANASAPLPSGESQEADQQAAPAQRSTDTRKAAETVASAIRETIKDSGCKDGSDLRDSELCAQWKAVDAARDAATYAWWTLLVSAVGTGLLVWTLRETRANARRELRAYVSVRVISTEIEVVPSKELRFKQQTVAHNGGSTPAYDFVSFGHITAGPHDRISKELAKVIPIQKAALEGGSVIHAGEDLPMISDKVSTLPISALDAVLNGAVDFYLFGTVSYRDTFGTRRRTDYCYVLNSESFRDSYIETMSNPGKLIQVIWKLAHFHNCAT